MLGPALLPQRWRDWRVFGALLGAQPEPDLLVASARRLLDVPAPGSLAVARRLMSHGLGIATRECERNSAELLALARAFARDLPGEVHVQLYATPRARRRLAGTSISRPCSSFRPWASRATASGTTPSRGASLPGRVPTSAIGIAPAPIEARASAIRADAAQIDIDASSAPPATHLPGAHPPRHARRRLACDNTHRKREPQRKLAPGNHGATPNERA